MRITDSRYDRDRLRLDDRLPADRARGPHPHHPALHAACRRPDPQAVPATTCSDCPASACAAAVASRRARCPISGAPLEHELQAATLGSLLLLLRPARPAAAPAGPDDSRRSRASATCTRRSCASAPPPRSPSSTPGTSGQVLCRSDEFVLAICPDCRVAVDPRHARHPSRQLRGLPDGPLQPDVSAGSGLLDCAAPHARPAPVRRTQRIRRTVSRSRRAPAQGRGIRRDALRETRGAVLVPVWRSRSLVRRDADGWSAAFVEVSHELRPP